MRKAKATQPGREERNFNTQEDLVSDFSHAKEYLEELQTFPFIRKAAQIKCNAAKSLR